MNEDLQALIQEMINSGVSLTVVNAFLLQVWKYISQGLQQGIDDALVNLNNSDYINLWSLFDEQILTQDINILGWYVNPH
jgi:hypothetical protein